MRDTKSLLLALLATGLVITWVYHIYDKSKYSTLTREVFVKDSIAVAEAVSDSLRKYYSNTLDQLGVEKMQIDSSNNLLKGELGIKITEINKLRADIGDILKRKNLTQSDLSLRNDNIYKGIGFNIIAKWQDVNHYEGTFVAGTLPAFTTVDAQVSYRVPKSKSVFRIGGSNILNDYFRTGYGSPYVGGLYYVSYGYNIF